MIPYGRHSLDEDDIQGVVNVLSNHSITQGEQVPLFENNLAFYCNAQEAVALNSATSALHTCYLSLGLGPGDWLWTSPITFVATSNAALMCGANIKFIDIEIETGLMSIESLKNNLELAEKQGCLPKIVVPVHYSGLSCDMQSMMSLSKKYGFKIVEDASHALGGTYLNSKIGSCEFSDAAIFSFHPVKMITTGEGGVIVSNSKELIEKARQLRSHGISKQPADNPSIKEQPWMYSQLSLGYNYRMADINAVLGVTQLNKLDRFIIKRRKIAEYYSQCFSSSNIKYLSDSISTKSSWHLYPVFVPKESRENIFNCLRDAGFGVNVHYIPVNSQPYYRNLNFNPEQTPNAWEFYQSEISLPIFPDLSLEQQDRVINLMAELL